MISKINFPILLLIFFPILTLAQTGSLQGRWNFLSLMANGESITLYESSKSQFVRFDKDGKLFSFITCNLLMGKYSLAKQRKLKVSSLGITLKGCLEEESKIERSLAGVLRKVTRYQIKGNILTLRDERGSNVVTLSKYQEPKENIQGGWKKFSGCGAVFSAPRTMRALNSDQLDSCMARFKNKDLQISVVSGEYGEMFSKTDSMAEYNEETINIDGKKTQLVTYISDFKDAKNKMQRDYVAGIYVSLTTSANEQKTIVSLVITVSGKTKNALETAKQIFKTIKFQ